MSSKRTAVSVRGLSKAYRIAQAARQNTLLSEAMLNRLRHPFQSSRVETFWALQDISFDVARGDVVGIIGRNGAGKSTLLKVLSRITEPTTGTVRLYGRVGSLLEVGTGFHPELTGRENIFLNGAILGMKRREIAERFDAIVEFAEVERFLDTPVKRYSSGMYVRLAFAVAAHLSPDILVVDEVLAVGDAEFQKKCLGKMQDVASSGRTVLFVSHNEAAVRRLCNSVILLNKGQVAMIGTPEQAFEQYRLQRTDTGFDVSNRRFSSPEAAVMDAYLSLDGIPTTDIVAGMKPTLFISIAISTKLKFSVEVLLRDSHSSPVMFGPVGLSRGVDYSFGPGTVSMVFQLDLPILAAGKYSLDLMIAETNIRFYDYLEEALIFNVTPSTNELTGWQFVQSKDQGAILLNVIEVDVQYNT